MALYCALESKADIPFLRRLYLSSRWEELAPLADWTDVQKRSFLESQFALQRQHYRTHFAETDFAVLERCGVPAGRLYIDRRADTLIVHDIALLPEWRSRGTGTALMEAICAEARATGKKVSVAVEKYNPAQQLYRRLGFVRSPTKVSIGSWNGPQRRTMRQDQGSVENRLVRHQVVLHADWHQKECSRPKAALRSVYIRCSKTPKPRVVNNSENGARAELA